jgi:DNA helicase IV
MSAVSHNGGFKPAQMYDWDADNNSIFYNNNSGRLAYKDQYGSVYDLY